MTTYRRVTTLSGTSYEIGGWLHSENSTPIIISDVELDFDDENPLSWRVIVWVTRGESKQEFPYITIPYHAVELIFRKVGE